MKRWVKNVICFGAIGLILVAAAFTMNYGKAVAPGNQINQTPGNHQMQQGEIQPPDMSADQAQDSQKSGGMPQDDNAQSSDAPPAKPGGENNTLQQYGTQPPDIPSEQTQGKQVPGSQVQTNQQSNIKIEGKNSGVIGVVDTYRFVIYGAYGLVVGVFAAYLIVSRCNKRKFRETIKGAKRICSYIAIMFGISIAASGFFLYVSDAIDLASDPGQMQHSNTSAEYKAVTTYDSNTNIEGQNYESTESDTLAVLVINKISAVLNNFKLNKTGSSNGGDNTSFYGTNSGITAKDGATLKITDADIFTDASGANGVFSFGGAVGNGFSQSEGDGTNVTLIDSNITTKQDNSGGVMVTGGGIMQVINSIIETFGTSSAALRTDRGGGNLYVEGGTYTTNGNGSPSIYSTADVNVKNAELYSNVSEGVCIEGKNSVNLENCKLIDNNNKLYGQSTTYKNIFLYQSMSGDSAEGTSNFSAKDCTLVTKNGDVLYVTNTSAVFDLENNNITNEDADGNLLRIQKDSWGKEGQNGGNVTFNMKNQKAWGNIVVDAISSLIMSMTEDSYWEGALNSENLSQNISLKIDKSSKIKLTADSYVTSLEDEDSSYSNIDFNGYKLYVNGTAIN